MYFHLHFSRITRYVSHTEKMSFEFESVHGLGGGMSLTAIPVAWMGSERDWQLRTGLAEGTDRMAGCSLCQRGRVLLPAWGGRDVPGKR